MKFISLFLFLFFASSLFSQSYLDTIVLKSGSLGIYRVLNVDDDHVYILKSENQKEFKIPLSSVAEIKYGIPVALKIDDESQTISVSQVIQVEGFTKAELYLSARTWMVSAFKDSKEVVEFADKESGKIIGKGNAFSTP